jgi:hypothetical protein
MSFSRRFYNVRIFEGCRVPTFFYTLEPAKLHNLYCVAGVNTDHVTRKGEGTTL